MHKNATKYNETLSKWCKNKHGASKIMDTLETYQVAMMTCVVVVLSQRSSSARVMPISSSELIFKIGATSHRREGSSVWHGPTWTSRGRCDGSSLVVSLVKSESLTRGGVMMMTPLSNLGDDSRHMWLCVRCSFGSQGGRVCLRGSRVP
jgi:hypothetical protein